MPTPTLPQSGDLPQLSALPQLSDLPAKHEVQPRLLNFIDSKTPYASDKAINTAITDFVATDMRTLCIVAGYGFKRLMHTMDSRYKVISRNTLLEGYLVPMYNLTKDVVIQNLAKAKSHNFTTDPWSISTMQSFITIPVHYIVECELHSNLLDTHRITGSQTGEKLCNEMIITEDKWGLREVRE